MYFTKYDEIYRSNLEDLTKMMGFGNDKLFNYVKEFIPSSLKLIDQPDTQEKKMNCHGYTFERNCWYEVMYVHKAIEANLLKETKEPQTGNIVLYYLKDVSKLPIIKHSAVYVGKGKVRSKWGNGPVFEHNVFNVPKSYGDVIKSFKKISDF